MIKHIRHKGLKRFYEDDDRRGLNTEYIDKISVILARLDRASEPDDLDLPGLRLHLLKGDLAGFWSITIRANWRIIFKFDPPDVTDVDLIDYH